MVIFEIPTVFLEMPYKDPELHIEHTRQHNREYQRVRRLNLDVRKRDAEYTAKWKQENPEYYKKYMKQHRRDNRIALISLLGHTCVYCGYDKDIRGLQVDHINGGGTKEEQETFNGDTHAMYRYYLKHPEEAKQKLQTLCANCNQIKRYENQEGVTE